MPRFLALFAALVIALITSCDTSAGQRIALPDGTRLLADSATAMRTVTSTHFTIDVQGMVPEVPFQSAEGWLTREGSAKGTIKRKQGGQLIELGVVILGDKLYLQPPTGPVQKLPLALAQAFYDPSVVLNPERGIAAVLASGKEASTEAREQVGGTDSYRVRVTFPAQPLSTVVPGSRQDRTGQVWIAVEGSRLVQARFPTSADGTITVSFSEFDEPVEITAPA